MFSLLNSTAIQATITKDNVTAALATLNRTMIKMGSQTTEVVLQYISIILLKACAIPGLNHTVSAHLHKQKEMTNFVQLLQDFMLFMNSFDTVLLTDTSTFQTSDSQKSSETYCKYCVDYVGTLTNDCIFLSECSVHLSPSWIISPLTVVITLATT